MLFMFVIKNFSEPQKWRDNVWEMWGHTLIQGVNVDRTKQTVYLEVCMDNNLILHVTFQAF